MTEIIRVTEYDGSEWVNAEAFDELEAIVDEALQLKGGWREAIVELEDFCSEPVRLKNMLAAADQLDRWAARARAFALRKKEPGR
jgi:hypothetical protein